MSKDDKKKRFYSWDDTPPQYRKPRTQAELAHELGVTSLTLGRWRKERWKEDVPHRSSKEEEGQNSEDYNSDEWLRNSTRGADKALVEAVKKGSPGAQKIFYQLIDRLREKADQPTKGELTADDIAKRNLEAERQLNADGHRVAEVSPESTPLPKGTRENS